MSLELEEILTLYDTDRDYRSPILDERIPDLHFARFGQNDDSMSETCTTEFVGQFDIISRERKRVQAELRQNGVEIRFRAKDADNDDLDEIMQGKYRTDSLDSKSKQVFSIAQDDAIDCGFGAWRLVTEEEDECDILSTNLDIRRKAIPEAIRKVFFDADSILMDKSDAKHCSVITVFTEKGYEDFLKDHDIDPDDIAFSTFDDPYESIYRRFGFGFIYPLFNKGDKSISILEFYKLEPEKQIWYIYEDVSGEGLAIPKNDAIERGLGEPLRKKTLIKNVCFKYLVNGVEILKRTKVPGGMIPIIPTYGERNFVDGVENFFGIVKAVKDPQKLINAALNYMASLMMFSPVPKPEFDPKEIEGLENFHEGAANAHNLAYQLRNKVWKDPNGGELIQFPTPTYSQPVQIPPAVSQLIATLIPITDQILNPGLTQDAFKTQASGVALQEIKDQIGMMTYIFLDNFAESKRRDAEVYAAMASEVFDVERDLVLTNPDGTTTIETINRPEFDMELIEEFTKNPVCGQRFNVSYKIGATYATQRDAALGNLKELFTTLPPGDPMQNFVMLSILSKQDGEGLEELNKAARFQLLALGMPGVEPQTEEEEEYLQQLAEQAQNQPPDPVQQALEQQAAIEAKNANTNEMKGIATARKDVATAEKTEAETEQIEFETDIAIAARNTASALGLLEAL